MPPEADLQRLREVVASGRRIQAYLHGQPARAALRDDERRSAILYRLIIHGEAAGQVSVATQSELPAVSWKAIKNLRNILVHRYWAVQDDEVAGIVEDSMPPVLDAIEAHFDL